MSVFSATGRCSWFGGPADTGVAADEGLAFIYEYEQRPDLFLDAQPPGTTGLARRLDPDGLYIACRWDYDETPKEMLASKRSRARVSAGGRSYLAWPADWGPHQDTGRVADLSPALMEALGVDTDSTVTVEYPAREDEEQLVMDVCISSGHGLYVRGANGEPEGFDEVDEARKVVNAVADVWREQGIGVEVFHDNTSHSQSENLNTIVAAHNATTRDLDVSVHFNAFDGSAHGTEVLYVTQSDLAAKVSAAIAAAGGFTNRGAKYRSDLYFLNSTEQPAVLLEVCFCDSAGDADKYFARFDAIVRAIADSIAGPSA